MKDPLFKVGQRVYSRSNPYHGKVVEIVEMNGIWNYNITLDRPNPKNLVGMTCSEEGIFATLEEAVAWQKAEMGAWRCAVCYQPNAWGAPKCVKCGRVKLT